MSHTQASNRPTIRRDPIGADDLRQHSFDEIPEISVTSALISARRNRHLSASALSILSKSLLSKPIWRQEPSARRGNLGTIIRLRRGKRKRRLGDPLLDFSAEILRTAGGFGADSLLSIVARRCFLRLHQRWFDIHSWTIPLFPDYPTPAENFLLPIPPRGRNHLPRRRG
jgi:hypothetical protein